jgi:putative pyruvate formate lyase activating enzyme
MARQSGPTVFDEQGLMRSGLLVRHLVLPGQAEDSLRCLEWIKYNLPNGIYTSIMSQYLPFHDAKNHQEISRKLTQEEYDQVTAKVFELGLENGFIQELEAASEKYIPEFDLTGI